MRALTGVRGLARGPAPAALIALAYQDPGAVLELVGAVHDDRLAGREPLGYRDVGGIAGAQRDLADADGLLGVDDVHVGARRAALDPGLRDECGVVQGVE